LSLFALEVVDLNAQLLYLDLCGAQVGGQRFDDIEQPYNQFTSSWIGNAGQIKVVEHRTSQVMVG
jgi:hypothetical protein